MKSKSKNSSVLRNPYTGQRIKKIELGPTRRLAFLTDLSDDFMKKGLGFEPGDYLITDESRLSDFTPFGAGNTSCFLSRIKKLYGIDVSDVPHGNLAAILRKIKNERNSIKARPRKGSPNNRLRRTALPVKKGDAL